MPISILISLTRTIDKTKKVLGWFWPLIIISSITTDKLELSKVCIKAATKALMPFHKTVTYRLCYSMGFFLDGWWLVLALFVH